MTRYCLCRAGESRNISLCPQASFASVRSCSPRANGIFRAYFRANFRNRKFVNDFNDGWRRGRDLNPRWSCPHAAFRVRCIQPLCHLSAAGRALHIDMRCARQDRSWGKRRKARGWNPARCLFSPFLPRPTLKGRQGGLGTKPAALYRERSRPPPGAARNLLAFGREGAAPRPSPEKPSPASFPLGQTPL
jgi:hypothetical protein